MSERIVRQVEEAIQSESLAEFVSEHVSRGNLSIRGMAALCGVNDTAIIRGADVKAAKLAETLETHGFAGADLSKYGFPSAAVWLVIEYYAYESKAAAPFAKQIARTFGAYGVKAAFRDAVAQPEPVKTLPVPTAAEQMAMIESAFKTFGLIDSPRHMQLARDHVANLFEPNGQPLLPEEKPMGVCEIAEALGYPAAGVAQVRSQLGKMIAAWYRSAIDEEPATEERIVNGRMCQLKVYLRTEELDNMISLFLDSKNIRAIA